MPLTKPAIKKKKVGERKGKQKGNNCESKHTKDKMATSASNTQSQAQVLFNPSLTMSPEYGNPVYQVHPVLQGQATQQQQQILPWANQVFQKLTEISSTLLVISEKTDKIEGIEKRLQTIEHNVSDFKSQLTENNKKISELKTFITFKNVSFEDARTDRKKMADVVDSMKEEVREARRGLTDMSSLRYDCEELYERVLDIQARSMRDNLLFNGIEEDVLHTFLKDQMKLEHSSQFDRIHRLSRKTPNPSTPRPIVANFVHYKDRETVRKRSKVLKGTHFGVSEQFPREIVERRKFLWSKFSEAKRQELRASLVIDKLLIEGKRWYPDSGTADMEVITPHTPITPQLPTRTSAPVTTLLLGNSTARTAGGPTLATKRHRPRDRIRLMIRKE